MQPNYKLSAKIIGTGFYVPTQILTNENIEEIVPSTNAEWTYQKLGVRQRHIARGDESSGTLAVEAAISAMKDANLAPTDINLIILATTTPRRVAPSTACYVQKQLGAVDCPAIDIAAVCSGFIYGLSIASQFIESGAYKNILVIGVDTFSKITDWTRRDCVFFGDGAGAAVLGPCSVGEGILSFDLGADGTGDSAWTVLAGGSELPTTKETVEKRLHYWKMDGKAVYEMAISRIPQSVSNALKKAGLSKNDVDHIIPHQPSIGILKKTAELMDIPFEKVHTNMDKYANTSAATVPIILDNVKKSGLLKVGQIVVLLAVGAGWTWGSIVMRWTD